MSSTPHDVPPPPPAQLGGGAAQNYAPTNNLAVVSFVAGIASFFAHVIPIIGGFTVAVIAIITGFVARGQIKRSGEQGMWMANAGIIIGFVHLALGFFLILLVLFLIFVAGIALFGISSHSGGTPSPVTSP